MSAVGAAVIVLGFVIYHKLQGRSRRIFAWSVAGLLVTFWTGFIGFMVLLD